MFRKLIGSSFSSLVQRDHIDRIVILTLNNPKKRNPLSFEMLTTLQEQFNNIDNSTSAVIIKSTGSVFSAGHDLGELKRSDPDQKVKILTLLSSMLLSFKTKPQVIIAQVNGLATAGGLQFVLACDLVTATPKSAFCTPGLNVGLFCTTPGIEISRILGNHKKAMEMLLTAEPVLANEAQQLGLINHVFQENEIDAKTIELAQKISRFSRKTIATGKRTYYLQQNMSKEQAYQLGIKTMVDNLSYNDTHEGIDAFLNKRKPQFKE